MMIKRSLGVPDADAEAEGDAASVHEKREGGDSHMKVPLNAETKAKCICKSCLTFIKNSLVGGVFCSMNSSELNP
ncbi:MAG: hypothetical protein WAN56_07385, partial [Halobacteriota archaeon]